jgi:hypothetical protein
VKLIKKYASEEYMDTFFTELNGRVAKMHLDDLSTIIDVMFENKGLRNAYVTNNSWKFLGEAIVKQLN